MKDNDKTRILPAAISFQRHILPCILVVGFALMGISYLRSSSNNNQPNAVADTGGSPLIRASSSQVASASGGSGGDSNRIVMQLENLMGSSSTGTVVLQIHPDWAPIGAKHFTELVQSGFYDACRFFRVVPNFVVQFGIQGDPAVQQQWKKQILKDDKVTVSNKRGTLTFATSGPNTRTTQLFINLSDNKFLDKQGFSPFAEIVEGMEFVNQIYNKYGEKPGQGKIQQQGNKYLQASFPKLSFIGKMYQE